MLGGRSAEEVAFGEISTGAENDLEHATALARQMVCMYGMSDRVGLVHVGNRQDGYFPMIPGAPTQRDCSEETIREIDLEVKKLLDDAHDDARAILTRAPRSARSRRQGTAQAGDLERDRVQRIDRTGPTVRPVGTGPRAAGRALTTRSLAPIFRATSGRCGPASSRPQFQTRPVR